MSVKTNSYCKDEVQYMSYFREVTAVINGHVMLRPFSNRFIYVCRWRTESTDAEVCEGNDGCVDTFCRNVGLIIS